MKVKELVEFLENCNQEDRVVIFTGELGSKAPVCDVDATEESLLNTETDGGQYISDTSDSGIEENDLDADEIVNSESVVCLFPSME